MWSWRVEDEAAYNKIFDAYEKAHPGSRRLQGLQGDRVQQDPRDRARRLERPRRRRRCAPTASCSPPSPPRRLVPLDGKVDLSGWDANVVASAKGKEDGKLYSSRSPARRSRCSTTRTCSTSRASRPPTTWAEFIAANDKLHGPASRRSPSAPRTTGRSRSCTRCSPRRASAARRSRRRCSQRPEDLHRPRLGRVRRGRRRAREVHAQERHGRRLHRRADPVHRRQGGDVPRAGRFDLAVLQKANPALKIGVFQVPAAARLARATEPHDRRLGRRQLRRLGQSRRTRTPGQGAGEVDVDQGVRPDGRRRHQADLRRARASTYTDPLLKQMSRQLRQEPGTPVPAARRLPLRHPLRHRPAGHGPAGAAARQEGRRRGQRRPHTGVTTSGSSRRRSPRMSRRTGLLFVAPALLLFGVFVLYPMVLGVLATRSSRWQGTTRGAFVGLDNFATLFTRAAVHAPSCRARSRHNIALLRRDDGSSRTPSAWASRSCCTAGRAPGGCCRRSTRCPTSSAPSSSATCGRCCCRRRSGRSTRCCARSGSGRWRCRGWVTRRPRCGWSSSSARGSGSASPSCCTAPRSAGCPRSCPRPRGSTAPATGRRSARSRFPLLVPAIGTVSVLTFIFAMEAFALPYALGGSTGNPAGATDFVSLLFYRTAFENGSTNAIGSSSAIATLLFAVIFGGAVLATRVLRRARGEDRRMSATVRPRGRRRRPDPAPAATAPAAAGRWGGRQRRAVDLRDRRARRRCC